MRAMPNDFGPLELRAQIWKAWLAFKVGYLSTVTAGAKR